MIVFVSGGARSGKSRLAERLTRQASPWRCFYVATANPEDAEMAERIARHRARRDRRWITLTAPLHLDEALARIPDGQAVLVDCLTLWASQLLFGANLTESEGEWQLKKLVEDARARRLHLVIVSNDLNEALLPDDPMVWRFINFLQRLHRLLAREADSVIEAVAGRGLEWKPGTHSDAPKTDESPL